MPETAIPGKNTDQGRGAVQRQTEHSRQEGAISPIVRGLPGKDMTRLLLHLQRTAGNRAVNNLLQGWALEPASRPDRQDREPTIPRSGSSLIVLSRSPSPNPGMTVTPIDPNPGMTVTPIAEPKRNDPLRKQARDAFITDRDMFANLWLTAATTALAGAPEAQDSESTQNWWVALAGNLLWAATSFVAPELVVTIRVMSVTGAAIGSGVLAQDPQTAPSGKKYIGELLTTTRDSLVQTADNVLDTAAQDCVDRDIAEREKQREVLWRRFFKTPYNQSEPIRAEMSDKIEAGLAAFLKQWHEWQIRRQGGIGQGAGAEPEEIPFIPQLDF